MVEDSDDNYESGRMDREHLYNARAPLLYEEHPEFDVNSEYRSYGVQHSRGEEYGEHLDWIGNQLLDFRATGEVPSLRPEGEAEAPESLISEEPAFDGDEMLMAPPDADVLMAPPVADVLMAPSDAGELMAAQDAAPQEEAAKSWEAYDGIERGVMDWYTEGMLTEWLEKVASTGMILSPPGPKQDEIPLDNPWRDVMASYADELYDAPKVLQDPGAQGVKESGLENRVPGMVLNEAFAFEVFLATAVERGVDQTVIDEAKVAVGLMSPSQDGAESSASDEGARS